MSIRRSAPEHKRQRKMLTIAEKVELLDMLKGGRSYAAVGRHYGINESTVRYIKKDESNIRATAAVSFNKTAKRVVTPRNKSIVRMESVLAMWISDCRKKNVSLDTNTIRAKAKKLYETLAESGDVRNGDAEARPSSDSATRPTPFNASKGWFDKFQRRFGLKGVCLKGEAASADRTEENANSTFKTIVEERACKPEQVVCAASAFPVSQGINASAINQQESPKRKREGFNGIVTDDSSDPDEDAPDADMAMFGPLESDIEESQSLRKDTESPTGSVSGQQLENESRDKAGSDDETDIESESLLIHERSSMETPPATTATTKSPLMIVKTEDEGFSPEQGPVYSPSVQQQNSTASPPSRDTGSPPCSSSSIPQAPVEIISPAELSAEPKARFDSSSFWKSCNAAGCTQAIFSDFTAEMNRVSSRIQSGQASQEDYDLALRVMEASGKLAELVTKQQEDLKRKQMEMQKAAAAMKEVVSTLKR